MSGLLRDLRFALRALARNPGFTAVALLTLALGIGASTTIFSVVNTVLLRPLPYPESERLVQVFERNLERGWKWYPVSPANFRDWRRQAESFATFAGYSLYQGTGFNLTGEAEPERINTTTVTDGFFEVFGVQPLHGRTFLPEEDQPGAGRVVVLTYGLWQRRFGGDRGILEDTVSLDGVPYQVVGIMPPGFRFPQETELWLPKAFTQEEWSGRTVRTLNTVARLKDGVSLQRAQEEMAALTGALEQEYPGSNTGFDAVIFTLYERTVGNLRSSLFLLLAAVGGLLLIACANVANLLLARATARGSEFALRRSLGASRLRLGRQLVTESVVLALVGGILGLAFTGVAVRWLASMLAGQVPRIEELAVDGRVLLFAFLASLITGVLFGLAPAVTLATSGLYELLKEGGRSGAAGGSARLLRRAVVVLEVAFALCLLVVAGLMMKSFFNTLDAELGFEPEGVLSLQVALPDGRYPDPARQVTFYRSMLEEVGSLPQVDSVGAASWLPLASIGFDWDFFIEGDPPETLDDVVVSGFRTVSPGYFATMGIPLKAGRVFNPQDREDSRPVVVINEAMARQFWPDESPLGERLVMGSLVADLFPRVPVGGEIIGVVGSTRQDEIDQPMKPEMYVPFSQYNFPAMFLLARTEGDPAVLAEPIRRAILNIDPNQPVFDVKTMETRLSEKVSQPRLYAVLLGAFAVLAVVLASVGIYGVMAFAVVQRRREIGMRMALGAPRRRVIRMVVQEGLTLAAWGLGLGLILTFLVSRWIESVLFEVAPSDPTVVVGVSIVFALVALLATLVPALRASRVDPMVALRYD
ncbi:MAG: ABC transporter permease [Acidobacteriota bacterium]|nr:ABC transporter permease [Acidobacteriota bacterium]